MLHNSTGPAARYCGLVQTREAAGNLLLKEKYRERTTRHDGPGERSGSPA
jgi:hypothetical protein